MKEILAALVAAFLVFGCTGYGTSQQGPTSGTLPAASNNGNAAGAQGNGVLFAGSQYAQTAVMVYPGSTTGQSSGEVPNFDLASVPNADGTVTVTMTEKSGGQKLSAIVPSGGSVYFNDANLGDDAAGTDKYLQDDTLIVVDKNGYVVQG